MSTKPVSVDDARAWLAIGIEDVDGQADDVPVSSAFESLIGLTDLSVIGSGAGGTVYRAIETQTGQRVALKVFGGEVSSGEEFQRFRQEARILAAVKHPSIAAIRRSGTVECGNRLVAYIVMDYVDGPDLGEWSASPGRSSEERLAMLAAIAEAVDLAHRHGVIHRDLKPSNIRISPQGRPIVLDFGIAHVVDPDARLPGLETATGKLLGTPAYMAPEQIGASSAVVDTRFDIYALGVMSFEVLAGVLPIQVAGLPLLRAIELIRESRPPRLGTFDAAFRGDTEAVVDRALAKSPEDRYRSAGEFASDLRRLVAGEPVSARLPGPMTELLRLARRYRRTTVVVVLVLATLVIAMIATLDSLRRARRADEIATAGWTRWLDFASGLEDVEVSTETRRAFASFVSGWSESFVADATLDDEKKRLIARTLDVTSDIELAGADRSAALEHRRRALELRRELAERQPDDIAARRQLSRAVVKVGDLEKEEGNFDAARDYYRENRRIDEQLLADHPGDPDVLDDWCWTLIRQIDFARLREDIVSAQRDIALLEPAARRLVEMAPSRPAAIYTLANVLIFIADIGKEDGAGKEVAERALDEALRVTEGLTRDHPGEASYRRLREKTLTIAARGDFAVGDRKGGVEKLDEAAKIAASRLTAEPSSASAWRVMTDVLRMLVEGYRREGEGHRGLYLATLRALVVLDREALRRDPEFAYQRSMLTRDALELLETEGHGREDALQAIDVMLRSIEVTKANDPEDAVARLFAARALVLEEAGDARDVGRARMLCEAALEILEGSSRMTPELYDVAARTFDALGDVEAASAVRERKLRTR